jgi:hypothetical protein
MIPVMTVSLNAHFDGKNIVLDEDFPLSPQMELLVTIIPGKAASGEEAERRSWSLLGKRAMARVYGDDEPDYSTP